MSTAWTSLLPFLAALLRNQNMPQDDDDSNPPVDQFGRVLPLQENGVAPGASQSNLAQTDASQTGSTSLLPFLAALQGQSGAGAPDQGNPPPADPTRGVAASGPASPQQANSATASKTGGGQTDTALALPAPAGAGPVASDPTAMNAFLAGLDNHKVGQYTVAQLANVLTNESRDLTFEGPPTPDGQTPLTAAKTVQAHAIINNASQAHVNKMAVPKISEEVSNSPAHQQDLQIMRQAYYDQMTGQPDPAGGRTYFGNSAEDLHSHPIGNSRQTVFQQFGPFRWGSNPPQYIYIYNDPIKRTK